jgi:hypothetical protein
VPDVASTGLTWAQQGELNELLVASAAASASLAAGSRAGDEIRLLNQKLRELAEVAAHTQPHEWDAMLGRLLRDEHCGAVALRRALRAEGKGELLLLEDEPGDNARLCGGADGRPRLASQPGEGAVPTTYPTARPERRRILQAHKAGQATAAAGERTDRGGDAVAGDGHVEATHPQQGRAAAVTADKSTEEPHQTDAGELGGGGWGVLSADSWRRWLLDRPPPWERDCDCCFEECPDGFKCLAQGDGLVLACRGDSVGEILQRQWQHAPFTMCLAAGAVVGAAGLWARSQLHEVQQLRKRSE